MILGHDHALRAHVEALAAELGRLADRLGRPEPAPSRSSARQQVAVVEDQWRYPSSTTGEAIPLQSLHRIAVVAEDEGWLDPGEAIVLRKLAFRVAFYLRRGVAHPP